MSEDLVSREFINKYLPSPNIIPRVESGKKRCLEMSIDAVWLSPDSKSEDIHCKVFANVSINSYLTSKMVERIRTILTIKKSFIIRLIVLILRRNEALSSNTSVNTIMGTNPILALKMILTIIRGTGIMYFKDRVIERIIANIMAIP